jgi:hypothetical protein
MMVGDETKRPTPMTTPQDHPITPPPELVQAFLRSNPFTPAEMTYEQFIATRFARWGSDQELEACCEWLSDYLPISHIHRFRAARRPKPPSLKEQALTELNLTADPDGAELSRTQVDLIRRALEQLPDTH